MNYINYTDILINKSNLAPSQLAALSINNKNVRLVADFLERPLQKADNGTEVGTTNYISKSHKFFIKAKAIRPHSFIPLLNAETVNPIRPQAFQCHDLKESDIVISKDSNIGAAMMIDEDMPEFMLSGALYKLPVKEYKHYLLAFMKHPYFHGQLDIMTPKGATIRHAGKRFLDCKIPMPRLNVAASIGYIEMLVKSIISKEKAIKQKNKEIFDAIKKELCDNVDMDGYDYDYPTIGEIAAHGRFDAAYHCREFAKLKRLIFGYENGCERLTALGYTISRGQNLQESQIGKSLYSDVKRNNFYTLARPTNFNEYGVMEKLEYLGNPRKLICIKAGDIVFSGEGTVGKCVLFPYENERWITNIHGIILSKKDGNMRESAFVASFLRYLRSIGYFDYISVGGQGGSLAMKYWEDVCIPRFPEELKSRIANLYYSNKAYPCIEPGDDFREKDFMWENEAGIIDLDFMIKKIKSELTYALDTIVNDGEVDTDWSRLGNTSP